MKIFKNPAIIGLIVLLVILGGAAKYISYQQNALYRSQEQANYDEVLSSDTPTVYYYYQDTCHFCESIKGEVTKFTDVVNKRDDIDFVLVDMKTAKNQQAWYDWDSHNKKYGEGSKPEENPDYISDPAEMKKIDDIKITGTPTMIYVKDKQVQEYVVGPDVFDLLDVVINEFDLGLDLDETVYGQGV